MGKHSRVKDLRPDEPDADELPQASQPQQWLGVKESIIVFLIFVNIYPGLQLRFQCQTCPHQLKLLGISPLAFSIPNVTAIS